MEQQDYRLVFYPHIEMQKDSRRFKSGSDRITIVSKETHDVQKLLMDCALLVTDYSSVFFDVAFLRKPVVYYQFDEEEFRKYHYQKGFPKGRVWTGMYDTGRAAGGLDGKL